MATNVTGRGYGKIILFGEHFVVYGEPAIASGIDKFVEVKADKIKDSDDVIFDDKVFVEKVSMKESPEHIKSKMVKAIVSGEEFLHLKGVKFTINSNMSPGGGLGYSAALGAALVRAINTFFDQDWKEEKISELVHKSEIVVHGEPSGIDSACAIFDTAIWFEKGDKDKKEIVRPIKVGKSLQCVLVDTGVKHSTKDSIALVKKFKEANTKKFDIMAGDYKKLAGKVKKEIQFGGIAELGKLMNQNHNWLKEIGLSTKEIDEITKIAIYDGAHGAKITGAGMGGNVLVLCVNEAQQDKLILAYAAKNYKAMKVKIS